MQLLSSYELKSLISLPTNNFVVIVIVIDHVYVLVCACISVWVRMWVLPMPSLRIACSFTSLAIMRLPSFSLSILRVFKVTLNTVNKLLVKSGRSCRTDRCRASILPRLIHFNKFIYFGGSFWYNNNNRMHWI